MIYCDIHPQEGESFVDAVIRTVPEEERRLSGLALKIICARLDDNKELEEKIQKQYNELDRKLRKKNETMA